MRVYSASQVSRSYGSGSGSFEHDCGPDGPYGCAVCYEYGWVKYSHYADLKFKYKSQKARFDEERDDLISERDDVERKMEAELQTLQSERKRDKRWAKQEIDRLEAELRKKEKERSYADARKDIVMQRMDQMRQELIVQREHEKKNKETMRAELRRSRSERHDARQEVERLKAELKKLQDEERIKPTAKDSDNMTVRNQMEHELERLRAYESESRKVVAASNELEVTKAMLASAEKQHEETKQVLAEKVEEIHGMQAFTTTADKVSVGDVVHLVHLLNADIHQTAAVIADSLRFPSSSRERVSEEVRSNAKNQAAMNGLGQILINSIRSSRGKQGYNPTVVQYALQVMMTGFCVRAIDEWDPSCREIHDWLDSTYDRIQTKEGQAVAGRWRALTRAQISTTKNPDTLIKVLAEQLIDILVMAGCSNTQAQVDDFRNNFEDRLSTIANLTVRIQTAVGEEITSVDVTAYTIPPGARFSMEMMEDMYGDGGPGDIDKPIAGTTELGIAKKDREGDVKATKHLPVVKAKIVLADVL